MNIKSSLFGLYFILAIGTSIYASIWGDFNYKGVAYNIGRGLVWPFIWFPTLGAIVGGIILVLFIAYISLKKQ